MRRDDALTGHFAEDLAALRADPHTADLFAPGLSDRFIHLQEVEARRLLSAEYQRPLEVRQRRSALRGEAIHRAFARLCAEADRERATPLMQVAADWSRHAQAERQLAALIASAHRSDPTVEGTEADRAAWPRFLRLRRRRRAPATWDWSATTRPDSTRDRLSAYHMPWAHMLMGSLIL